MPLSWMYSKFEATDARWPRSDARWKASSESILVYCQHQGNGILLIEVDWWLDHLSLAHDAVSDLIGYNALDMAIVEEVSGRPGELFDAVLTML